MLVRAVIHHQVHDDADAPLLRLRDKTVQILHRPEAGIDGIIVGDVIALVGQGEQ